MDSCDSRIQLVSMMMGSYFCEPRKLSFISVDLGRSSSLLPLPQVKMRIEQHLPLSRETLHPPSAAWFYERLIEFVHSAEGVHRISHWEVARTRRALHSFAGLRERHSRAREVKDRRPRAHLEAACCAPVPDASPICPCVLRRISVADARGDSERRRSTSSPLR